MEETVSCATHTSNWRDNVKSLLSHLGSNIVLMTKPKTNDSVIDQKIHILPPPILSSLNWKLRVQCSVHLRTELAELK